MAPRRRIKGREDWPEGLYQKSVRGESRFYFRDEDGSVTYFPSDTSLGDAFNAAKAYNEQYRNPNIKIMESLDRYNKRLRVWLPKVITRVKEEGLSENAWRTFQADCDRLLKTLGETHTKKITLSDVNDFLQEHFSGKSNNVYNRKISFLNKVFSYLCDMSAMDSNPATLKKPRKKAAKVRQRLSLEAFKKILACAPPHLQVAMELSIQTTHAVLEVSRIKYSHCEFFKSPKVQDGQQVFGVLRIHRQKVSEKEASRVAIPITKALRDIIKGSYDRIASPYVVHKAKMKGNKLSDQCTHWTQLTSRNISNEFSELRDKLELYADLDKAARPTFHEIRALAIHLYTQAGIDPQSRAAHTDAKSTKIYQRDHVEWVEVPPAEINI